MGIPSSTMIGIVGFVSGTGSGIISGIGSGIGVIASGVGVTAVAVSSGILSGDIYDNIDLFLKTL